MGNAGVIPLARYRDELITEARVCVAGAAGLQPAKAIFQHSAG